MRPRRLSLLRFSVCFVLALAGCAGEAGFTPGGGDAGADPVTPDTVPDGAARAEADLGAGVLIAGGDARVVASSLNLRSGPGTTNAILTGMSCGDRVAVLGGPQNGWWWNVRYQGTPGWASGKYLVPEPAFDPAICTPAAAADLGTGVVTTDQAGILGRAMLAVGYSYYWGHGSWRTDGAQVGSCLGTCPSCSHSGPYGADCSGFVAKCWQIPSPSPVTTDLHPYSSWNFYNQTTHWMPVPRSQIQPADALVHNANGSGHIALFESGNDPWGGVWLYEARGCSTGIVHNLRSVSAQFITIRREGL